MQKRVPGNYVHCVFCGTATTHPVVHFEQFHFNAFYYCRKNAIDSANYFSTFTYQPSTIQEAKKLLTEENWQYIREFGLKLIGGILEKPVHRPPKRTAYKFIWKNVFFKNRSIQICNIKDNKRFLPIAAPNSTELLEKIKEEFFTRNHGNRLYKLQASGNSVDLAQSPDVQAILHLIDAAVELYNFRYERKTKSRYLSEEYLTHMSNDDVLGIFKKDVDKGPYIKALYSKHSQDLKLIPILESIGNSLEESFLFRVERRGNIFVMWENINPARATYVFKTSPNDRKLKEILKYISEHENSKRLYLKSPQNFKWASKNLGYVDCIEHDGLSEYKKALSKLIH